MDIVFIQRPSYVDVVSQDLQSDSFKHQVSRQRLSFDISSNIIANLVDQPSTFERAQPWQTVHNISNVFLGVPVEINSGVAFDELEDIFGIRDDTIGVECSQISQEVLYCAANSITTALPMASFM